MGLMTKWTFALLLFAYCVGSHARAALPLLSHPIEGPDLLKETMVQLDPKAEPKPAVVVFLSAVCPCSASHEPTLTHLSKEFPAFRFVGIHSNVDESVAMARQHFVKAALPFPIIQDNHARIASELGAFKTPHAFIFSRSGEILYTGGVDNSHFAERASKHYLKEALVAIASGREPAEKENRTLGCIIKRD